MSVESPSLASPVPPNLLVGGGKPMITPLVQYESPPAPGKEMTAVERWHARE
jgi:hypothetical protein